MPQLKYPMTADQHARDVRRENDDKIGSIQWHNGRGPCFVSTCRDSQGRQGVYSLTELEDIVAKLRLESSR